MADIVRHRALPGRIWCQRSSENRRDALESRDTELRMLDQCELARVVGSHPDRNQQAPLTELHEMSRRRSLLGPQAAQCLTRQRMKRIQNGYGRGTGLVHPVRPTFCFTTSPPPEVMQCIFKA